MCGPQSMCFFSVLKNLHNFSRTKQKHAWWLWRHTISVWKWNKLRWCYNNALWTTYLFVCLFIFRKRQWDQEDLAWKHAQMDLPKISQTRQPLHQKKHRRRRVATQAKAVNYSALTAESYFHMTCLKIIWGTVQEMISDGHGAYMSRIITWSWHCCVLTGMKLMGDWQLRVSLVDIWPADTDICY